VAWTTPQPRQDEFSDISVAGDYLVVNRNRRGQADVHVYRLDTLAEVWHAANPNGWAFGCGPALCLAGGTDLVAYDLATGRRRWQRDGVTAGGPVRDDRVIADDGGHPLLLDAATGHQIGERGDGITVWTVEPSTALYLLRSTRTPPGRTSVTRWDVATGRTRLLGAVDPVPGERCQVLGHHLACIADRAFKVIELP
jgi:outer membrane protein assembly factor BamB